MSKGVIIFLVLLGTMVTLGLGALGIKGHLDQAASEFNVFARFLGYEKPKNYAVFLLGKERVSTVAIVTVSDGNISFEEILPVDFLSGSLLGLTFETAASVLIEKLESMEGVPIDAVGFVTDTGAGSILDAFGGLYSGDQRIDSKSLAAIETTLLTSQDAVLDFNSSIVVRKRYFVTHMRPTLAAAKAVFANGSAALYFKNDSLFGKRCLGACEVQVFEYIDSDATVNR